MAACLNAGCRRAWDAISGEPTLPNMKSVFEIRRSVLGDFWPPQLYSSARRRQEFFPSPPILTWLSSVGDTAFNGTNYLIGILAGRQYAAMFRRCYGTCRCRPMTRALVFGRTGLDPPLREQRTSPSRWKPAQTWPAVFTASVPCHSWGDGASVPLVQTFLAG